MTKPVTRKMAVDCLLFTFATRGYIKPGHCPARIDCMVCGEPIEADQSIQFDHIFADALGGPHEYMNLRPLHTECHKRKSKADVQALAKIDRLTGVTGNGPKRSIPSRPFPKSSRPMQSGKTRWAKRGFQKRVKT